MRFLLLLFLIVSCSDETLDRDDLNLKAIYQEYHLEYNLNNNTVLSEVYFRTSSTGSYVKLNDADDIYFNIKGDDLTLNEAPRYTLNFKRKQVWFGSKNVPYYMTEVEVEDLSNKKFYWTWYDSETDQDIINEAILPEAELVCTSHSKDNALDTTLTEDLVVTIKEELKEGQTLHMKIINPLYDGSVLYYTFLRSESEDHKTFKVSSDTIRYDARTDLTTRIEQKKRRYGNLSVDVKTEEIVPVLDSGQNTYILSFSIEESNSVDSSTGKGGQIYKTVVLPDQEIDIIF